MTAPTTVQRDPEVLLLVISVMLGGFHGLSLHLEVAENTLMWNVPAGLILLYSVYQQTLLTTVLPKLVFQDVIFTFMLKYYFNH
jgi:hypothetical protein